MRVLFCTLNYPPGIAGGAERQAQLQAEGLARRGHRVDVVCPAVQGQRSGWQAGVRVIRLPVIDARLFRTITYLPLLFAFLLLRARNYQLIHVHLANLQADVAALGAQLSAVPTYLKLAAGGPRGEIGRMRPVSLLTRFYGIRHAAVIQAISDEIAADAVGIGVDDELGFVASPTGWSSQARGEQPTGMSLANGSDYHRRDAWSSTLAA